jgi:MFS family permease
VTSTIAPAATDIGGRRLRLRRLVAALAVTQTVGYGVLYYAFSVLITPMAADLHTSTPRIAAALTVSVLISAVVAVPVGRWLDHHGGRLLMAVGSLLGVIAVAAWSQVRTPTQLYAVFVVIGVASAMSLYEAAFSVVIAAAEPATRNRSLLAVTVVAGFASSIFFPLTGWLAEAVGWRTTLVVLALLLGITAIPGHLLAVPRSAVHRVQTRTHVGESMTATLRDTRFWLLGSAFVLQTAATAAVGVLLVTVLRVAGHSATTAATLAGLLGVLSVTGRLATTALARRFGIPAIRQRQRHRRRRLRDRIRGRVWRLHHRQAGHPCGAIRNHKVRHDRRDNRRTNHAREGSGADGGGVARASVLHDPRGGGLPCRERAAANGRSIDSIAALAKTLGSRRTQLRR